MCVIRFERKVIRVGDSVAVCIPMEIAKMKGIKQGDTVIVYMNKQGDIVVRQKNNK